MSFPFDPGHGAVGPRYGRHRRRYHAIRGAASSKYRLVLAARMPQHEHMESAVFNLVVDEVPDTAEKEALDTRSSRAFILRADPRLLGEKGDGCTEVRTDRPGSSGAILRPPLGRSANLTCCSKGNLDPKCHAQPCFGNDCSSSSRVTYSPRSISAMAAKSSFSCASVSEKLSSAPRVTTATIAPSVRGTPSTTIFPLTTVPVATCMPP